VNNKIEDLMYRSGLTAQGCWDEMDAYDREAIEKLVELTVKECSLIVANQGQFLRYDKLSNKIRDSFGIK
jgi:cell division FtsZ-interacting protein ZapD